MEEQFIGCVMFLAISEIEWCAAMKDHKGFLAGMTIWNSSEGRTTGRVEMFYLEPHHFIWTEHKVHIINRGCSLIPLAHWAAPKCNYGWALSCKQWKNQMEEKAQENKTALGSFWVRWQARTCLCLIWWQNEQESLQFNDAKRVNTRNLHDQH